MSFSYGFYNSTSGDRRYDATQMSQIFDGLIQDGVYASIGDAFMVKASENSGEVVLGTGRAWFNHTWNLNDAELPISVPESDYSYYRYDALAISVKPGEMYRENNIIWLTGTATSSSSPTKPAPVDTDDEHQHILCYIYRRPNTETINQADIENAVGTSVTPFVTGIIDTITTDALLAQWVAQWNNLMYNTTIAIDEWIAEFTKEQENWEAGFESDSATWLSEAQTAFSNWFQARQDTLDSDVAENLQRQIDNINGVYVQDNVLYIPNTFASVSDGVLTLGTTNIGS